MTELTPSALTTVMLPVTFSAEAGLNDTFISALCPAANVSGVVIPLTVKFFAFTLICEMVTLPFPLLVTVTLLELAEPAFTLEKLRVLGFAERLIEVPVLAPVKAKTLGEFGALLEILTVPV
jgi:hypothetical protein